jgi:hypothetical protein
VNEVDNAPNTKIKPFDVVSYALYNLMCTLIMKIIHVRFCLINSKPGDTSKLTFWRNYYTKNKHRVSEHVKYVMMCNMQIIACNFMDDTIGKNLKNKNKKQ